MSSFQLVGLSPSPFASLFALSSDELERIGAQRVVATNKPGFPCRVGLVDAEPGDELLLLPFEHQPAHSPYRSSGPVYVRRDAVQRTLAAGEIPASVRIRQISLRAYDRSHRMIAAEVCAGTEVGAAIERLFDDPLVGYLHLHNAGRGCFSCSVRRVPDGSAES